MATPALIVVVTVAIVTLGALAATVLFLLRELKRLLGTLSTLQEDLQPALEQLAADAAVTQQELERVSEAASRIGDRQDR